jgi:hypothetical protein
MINAQQPIWTQPAGNVRRFNAVELRNYFLPSPGRSVFTLILLNLFILLLVIPLLVINTSFLNEHVQSFLLTGAIIVVGAPLGISSIRLILYYLRPRPRHAEYDAWVHSCIPAIQQIGLQELNLDPGEIAGQPLCVPGMIWPDSPEAEFYRDDGYPVIKQDPSGFPRSSINRFICFYPNQYDIAIFTCDVNALYAKSYSRAQRYFYKDIVGIETIGLNVQLGDTSYTLRRFELHVANGQHIGIPAFVFNPYMMQTVGSLNTLLRDKKNGPGRTPAGL